MSKKYEDIILWWIIDKINESSDLTKQEKNNYKKAINWKSENEINEILDWIKNLVWNNLNEKYIKAHVHIWHWPIWNPKDAKYIILWTFPWIATIHISNKNNNVYYCDPTNRIRNVVFPEIFKSPKLKKLLIDINELINNIDLIFRTYDEIIKNIIGKRTKDITRKNFYNLKTKNKWEKKLLNKIFELIWNDKILKDLKKDLHKKQFLFCKETKICLWDRVEICFCPEWSLDDKRLPILYKDFEQKIWQKIILNWIIYNNKKVTYLSYNKEIYKKYIKNNNFFELYSTSKTSKSWGVTDEELKKSRTNFLNDLQ